MIEPSSNGSADILINKQWPIHISKYLQNDFKQDTVVQMSNKLLKSSSIHSVQLLRDLFISGKLEFIMKVFVKMH